MLLLRVTSMSKGINFTPSLAESTFTTRRPSSYTRHGCIRLAPIVQYSPLLPPVGVWTVSLSSSVAGHPLRPARDRRLGEPLPHQQANPIWAHPMARGPRVPSLVLRRYAVLATVSSSCPLHQAVSQTLLTRPPLVSETASCFPVTVRLACVRPAASVQSEP